MNLAPIGRRFSYSYAPKLAILRNATVLLAGVLLYGGVAHAEDPPGLSLGDKHRNILQISKKQIPLPPGEWEVVTYADKMAFTTNCSPIGKIASVALARRQDGKVTMALYVRTNLEQIGANGWVRSRSICDRKNVHFNESDKNYNPAESECWQINHIVNVYRYTDSDVFRQSFKAFQRAEFDTTTAIAPEFWVNDQYDMMFLRYYILPVRHGFERSTDQKWNSSEWHPEAIIDNANRKGLVSAVKKFGELLYPRVKEGFANDLTDKASVPDFAFKK
jgi:hypothetical protein